MFDKKIRDVFNESSYDFDVILLKNGSEPFIDDSFFHLTGLEKGLFENCAVVLYPDGGICLIVSELEAELAVNSKMDIKIFKNGKEFDEILSDVLGSYLKIGLNFNGILQSDFERLKKNFDKSDFFDVSDVLGKIRAVKDDIEIEKIREACKIVDKVMEDITGCIKKDMYEYELAAEINYLMQKYGADRPAFNTISSFGVNTSKPHYSHGDTKLCDGDFVLLDFGASYKRYNSDITRTFIFKKATKEQKKIYDVVSTAQNVGLDLIKSGVKANLVHDAVSSYIDKTDYKGFFIHSTGHSLGLGVHDPGVGLNKASEVELLENMVLTVEPGLYIPGFGGVRIEDDIVVKRDGIELMTKTSRLFREI